MRLVPLGTSGLKVTKLCFGTLTMSPLQRDFSPERGAELLLYAHARGVRFLDTADLYETYPHIRLALKQAPDYVVSTKAYCYDRATARAALERAFRGIDREYVDLFMLHEQESLYTLRGHEEALDFLEEQRALGRIGTLGASTHYAGCVRACARFPRIRVVHPILNLGGVGIRDGSREDMEAAIAHVRQFGVGIFAMKPLGGGHLIAANREAMAYALTSPLVDSVAVGMQSEAEIDANVALAEGDPAPMNALRGREREMMVHDYCEGCGRCAARCHQGAISIVDGRAAIDQSKCVFCGYCARVCPQFCIKVV